MPYSEHGAKWIRRSRRLAIYMRDGFHCVYCQRPLINSNPRGVTLDHVDGTVVFGSADHRNINLVTCCESCNKSKQDTPLVLWASIDVRLRVRKSTQRQPPIVLANFLLRTARATKRRSRWLAAFRKAQAIGALDYMARLLQESKKSENVNGVSPNA